MARYLRKASQEAIPLRHRLLHGCPPSRTTAADEARHLQPWSFSGVFSLDRKSATRLYGTVYRGRPLPLPQPHGNPGVRSMVSEFRTSKACRSYYVDARGYEHFSRKGSQGMYGKHRSQQYILLFISAAGTCAVVYYSNLEVVPYIYRKHFVLIPPEFEVSIVEQQFQALKDNWRPFILPPIHPAAIRVRRIASDIIHAVMEGAKAESWVDTDIKYNGATHGYLDGEGDREVLMFRVDNDEDFPVSKWGHNDDTANHEWVEETRQRGLKKGDKPYLEHLKHMKWEVLVVDKNIVNAFCLPGGKIVVFTGLLKHFPTDAEIATVLGHEVAHVVARHSAERMTRHIFVTLIELAIMAFFYAPDLVRSASTLLLELPFSRNQELEADHIGLLLMAAAGYDPRVAPLLYEKLGKLGGSSELLQYVTTHPSGKKRGEMLLKTGTMEQALNIYQAKHGGRVVKGFLDEF